MLETDERVWHYIKPNESTRIPRRHVFLDTEANSERVHNGHIQSWRLAVACFWRGEKGKRQHEYWREFTEQLDLWKAVSDHARREARTVVWCHNLAYDVRIGGVFVTLPKLGWKLVAHNLAPRGTWLEWRRDRSTLVMVDSASVYPTTLAKVGGAFGLGKVDLPSWTDDDASWFARCRQDVAILRTAILAYLDWIETADLGNWQVTGSAQGWATLRHKFLTHKMLVHDDEQALAAERRAMWTGRCEAYWRGTLETEIVHEWDFSLAYARIAATTAVPVRLLGPMPVDYDWRSVLASPNVALLAKVAVRTDVPVVPAHVDGRIVWPVGEFETTLWDVEISAAIEAGASVVVRQGWLYRSRPALAAWGRWVIDLLEADEDICPTWQKIILKAWARSVVGRMAMTYTEWEHLASGILEALRRSTVYDRDTGQTSELLQVGTEIWESKGRVEWRHSMPMVTGFIQAVARVNLWRLIGALPSRAVLYVDTDSILVPDQWSSTVDDAVKAGRFPGLRLKKSWQGFSIYGPRQIRTGTELRIAGLPKRARRTGRHKFEGEAWESLPASLRSGSTDRVVIRDRSWEVHGVDHRRVGTGFGWTEPLRVSA